MKEKIIKLNKFVDNVCGSCFFFASQFGTAYLRPLLLESLLKVRIKNKQLATEELVSSEPACSSRPFFSKKKKIVCLQKRVFVKKLPPSEIILPYQKKH